MKNKKLSFVDKNILIADDDRDILECLALQIKGLGFAQVIAVSSQAEAEQVIAEQKVDIAIFDLMMENQDSGFVLCYHMKRKSPQTPVLLITNVTAETGFHFDLHSEENSMWTRADVIL
ncbi:MAG: response regulator, partial [Planctomycetes bacterium]|nr:response regulator [Planctomycetota bacterium]